MSAPRNRKPRPTKQLVVGPATKFAADQAGVGQGQRIDARKQPAATPSVPTPHPVAADPQVISRQRTLRAAGYPVAVDGVWGPASQSAWSSYVTGVRSHPTASGPLSSGGRQAAQQAQAANRAALIQQQTAHARALARKAQQQARVMSERARKEAQLQVQMHSAQAAVAKLHSIEPTNPQITARLNAVKARLQARPSVRKLQLAEAQATSVAQEIQRSVSYATTARQKAPQQMDVRELVATTVDPLTGTLDPSKPDEVRRVQLWLRAHGHPQLTLDGNWGPATNTALMTTFHKYEAEQRHNEVAALAQRFYDSKVVEVGKPIGPFAAAPKPGELLAVIQKGGFMADVLWRDLVKRYTNSQSAFLHVQERQLDTIEQQISPFFTGSPLTQLGVKSSVSSRVHRLQLDASAAADRGEMSAESARSFIRQIGVLGAARDERDLKARLLHLKVQLDQDHQQAIQQRLGEKHHVHGFWGHTLHAFGLLGLPAHYLVSGVEAGVADAVYLYHHPGSALALTRSSKENAAIKASVDAFQAKNPWTEFALEAVFDPMWLVNPVAIVGKVGEAGAIAAYRMERLGLTIEEGGRLARIAAPALTKPADTIRAFQLAGHEAHHFATQTASGRLLQLDHFYNVARKLGQQKQKAIAVAIGRVRQARSNRFRDLGTDLWGGSPLEGEIRFELDKTAPVVQDTLRRLSPTVIKHLTDSNLSLFVDIERTEPTVIAGQLRGFLTRHAQVTIGQNLAIEDARAAFLHTLFGRDDLAAILSDVGMSMESFVQRTLSRSALTDDAASRLHRLVLARTGPVQAVTSQTDALAAARSALTDTLSAIDFRGFGGHDVEMALRVKPLIERAQNDISDVISEIQTHVESSVEAKAALDATHPGLFDKTTGRWVGAGSDLTRTFLKSADEGFAEAARIANRAFGRAHTMDEMIVLRQLELNAAVSSAGGTVSRNLSEGFAQKDALVEKIANEKRLELEQAWQKRDGSFFDNRPEVIVPGHYATHLRQAFGSMPSSLRLHLPESIKSILAVSVPGTDSAFVKELSDLGFAISHARSLHGFDLMAAKSALDQFNFRSLGGNRDIRALVSEFRDALTKHSDLLDQAERIVTPRELVRERAYWAALAKAQSAPLRYTYKALSAFLDVWLVATLGIPRFVVRNVIDNTGKMLADGAIDPRFYFPKAAHGLASVFELGIQEMRYILTLGGRFQHNPAIYYFDQLIDAFWQHDGVILSRIFDSHGLPIPEAAIDKMRFGADEAIDPAVIQSIRKLRNKVMYVMGSLPENAAKRVLYRDTYIKAIENGATEMEAFDQAIKRIDFVLFDYSDMTVIEDNLRFIFPFVQFWRKTATFWTATAVKTPALPVEVDRFEQTLREKENADVPSWMRRYVNITPVTSTLARIPGLQWMLPGLQDGLQTDPLNFFSFNILYRTFKQENPNLPADKQGMKFIGPFVDALNDWGLSMNPLVRKPAEFAGVFNYRAWQTVFPETGVIDAISRSFLDDGKGFNVEAWLEDKTLGLIGYDLGARQRIEDGFNQWVQLEMAAQADRGEPVNRDAATLKIQRYYVVQTILGFFAGMYARRRDTADVHLYNLAEGMHENKIAFDKLSKKDQRAYSIFRRRKMDAGSFDHWVETQPQLEAFYRLNGDHAQREAFKAAHPEIIPYVNGWHSANVAGRNFVKTLPLLAETETAISLFHAATELHVPFQTRKAAEALFVTRELRDFWANNDTPEQLRHKMLQGELHRHIQDLQQAFFSIPESHHEARQGFLKANPLLGHSWQLNNSNSDDLKSVMNTMNATLRDRYFEYLDAKDYSSARDFLHRFPFIFEFTSAEAKVNAHGDWISFGGKHGMTQHGRDYLAAKQYLNHFFALMNSGNKHGAFAYMNATPQLRAYFAKWGKHHGGHGSHGLSKHAHDYLAIKSVLQWFFKVLKSNPARAQAWLDGDNPDAKKVRDYFAKYAHPSGNSAHALAYGKVKDVLHRYFELRRTHKDAEARKLLDAHPELTDYFKRFGKTSQLARKWGAELRSMNPDLDRRLNFWQRYWTLPPDERPAFVADHADDAGVFVYGSLSSRQQEESTRDYLRQAMMHKGMTKKVALYLRVKPLLDLYYTLHSPSEKDLFLRANPEVQSYLDVYGGSPKTGNKKLDVLIESYFKLDRHSHERSDFLRKNPQLQAYFDRNSSPADVAMRDLLDTYFKTPQGEDRKRFSRQHPEIQAYFDARKRERDNELAAAMQFDMADPRLVDYLHNATNESGHAAELMLRLLRESVARNKFGDAITRRVDRAPTVK